MNDVTDIFHDLPVACKLYADDIKLYMSYCLNAQRNGCPAEYRWRPLFNAAFG